MRAPLEPARFRRDRPEGVHPTSSASESRKLRTKRRSSNRDRLVRCTVESAIALLLVAQPLFAGSPAAARTLKPRLGRAVIVSVVSGNVRIRPRHSRSFVLLKGRRLIGVGATVDASHGTVRVVTARNANGGLQSGVFDGGAFVVTQERSGLVDLLLAGGRRSDRACRAAAGRDASAHTADGRGPQAAAAVSPTVLRLLHSRAHGRFRTRGKYAAATVRGTQWTTMDRCDGTGIADHTGRVMSQTRNAPLQFELAPGQTVGYRCARGGAPPVSTGYCLAVLAQDTTVVVAGHKTRVVLYAAGLITMSPDDETDLCVTGPTGKTTCTPYPLSPADRFGFREAIVGCVPNDGAGDYEIGWRVRGIALGAPLSYHAPAPAASLSPCRAWLGKPQIGGSLAGFACRPQGGQSLLAADGGRRVWASGVPGAERRAWRPAASRGRVRRRRRSAGRAGRGHRRTRLPVVGERRLV